MYYKIKKINGREYKYAVKSVRLPDGKIISLEKKYNNQPKKELEKFFKEKEIYHNTKYILNKYKKDNILTEDQIEKIEEIKFNYKKIKNNLTRTSLKDLLDRFTINFTYETNAIEGNSLTLKDVALVIFENTTINGKDLREIYETKNSRKVVDLLVRNKFNISEEDIIKIHKMLVKDTDIQTGYKRFPNIILGKTLKTTPPEHVKAEMKKLTQYYKDNKGKMHPIKLASLFHGRFEKIHPFEDGNGRVGRLIINLILIKNKYPPLIIRKSQRIAYLSSLEAFDNKHTEKLERFILDKFKNTYKNFFEVYMKYLD